MENKILVSAALAMALGSASLESEIMDCADIAMADMGIRLTAKSAAIEFANYMTKEENV